MIKMEVLMMKRLLCLLLALIMLLSLSLVGCDKEEEEEGADVDKNTGAKTITLRIITEKEVCNSEEELAEYLKDECGGNKDSKKYQDMKKTMEAYQAVEDEIAKKTKSDFKTNVDILFYTEDEYAELLEISMEEYALEQKNAELAERALEQYIKEYRVWLEAEGYPASEYPDSAIAKSFYTHFPEHEKYKDFTDNSGSSADEDQYVENDLGIKELVYPEAEKNQLDIVYISGYDMYMKYVENGWITPLNNYINTTGLQLTYNISPTLLNGVKIDGETYAIPNNVQIGEYTYMLVDKDLATKYKHTYESFNNVVDCNVFVNDVYENHDNILPIDSTFEECMNLFVWYWNIEVGEDEYGMVKYGIDRSNKFSVVGKFYSDPAEVGRGSIDLGFNSLLADPEYRETLLCLKEYELKGCYNSGKNETRTDPAISFVKDGYAMYKDAFYDENGNPKDINDADYGVYTDKSGKEYFLYVAKYPQAGDEELYGNMFAISANSKNTEACMDVINLINTDPSVRNLLQYGIKQGEHKDGQTPNYAIDELTGKLKRLEGNLYLMKIERTGNCFIAYPEEGLEPDYWENAKAQNNDAVIDPLMGFDFSERLAEYGSQLDNSLLEKCAGLSEETWELIAGKGVTYEILKSRLGEDGELTVKFSADSVEYKNGYMDLAKLTNKNYDTSGGADGEVDPSGESPYTVYYKWLTDFGYLPVK